MLYNFMNLMHSCIVMVTMECLCLAAMQKQLKLLFTVGLHTPYNTLGHRIYKAPLWTLAAWGAIPMWYGIYVLSLSNILAYYNNPMLKFIEFMYMCSCICRPNNRSVMYLTYCCY